MGTTLRKKAVKKPVKKNGDSVLLESVQKASSALVVQVSNYLQLLEAVDNKSVIPQSMLEAAWRFEKIVAVAASAKKAFDAVAMQHNDVGGGFIDGPVSVAFPETTRCSPKWKDEAIKQAGFLAEAKGKPFNPKLYEVVVKKDTPLSTSIKVKLSRVEEQTCLRSVHE